MIFENQKATCDRVDGKSMINAIPQSEPCISLKCYQMRKNVQAASFQQKGKGLGMDDRTSIGNSIRLRWLKNVLYWLTANAPHGGSRHGSYPKTDELVNPARYVKCRGFDY
ncbi:hypothetical protein WN51_09166 [Melipona quadrifasciata]|uniref:Uncharacterized protein n=1 Tax=Melipona quadrifasciata TaxID=166423 RepID=A0A0M8ZPV6_9HYME|nr:hypothetical protein WN51_09166 [Melipona quadrifasciata]